MVVLRNGVTEIVHVLWQFMIWDSIRRNALGYVETCAMDSINHIHTGDKRIM